MLKRLFSGLLTCGVAIFPLIYLMPVNAQDTESDAEQQCRYDIDRAVNILVGNRHLWVANINASSAEELYISYPYQHPVILHIAMSGNAVSAVMASPQLLTTVTRTIMTGCSRIGMVSYSVYATDWVADFGLIGNEIRLFECVDLQYHRVQWGQTVCL